MKRNNYVPYEELGDSHIISFEEQDFSDGENRIMDAGNIRKKLGVLAAGVCLFEKNLTTEAQRARRIGKIGVIR